MSLGWDPTSHHSLAQLTHHQNINQNEQGSNDPINGNANGSFHVYYQNVHGIPWEDVNLSQDLQTLAEYDVGCFCLSETNLD
jgi:hypothetical protein